MKRKMIRGKKLKGSGSRPNRESLPNKKPQFPFSRVERKVERTYIHISCFTSSGFVPLCFVRGCGWMLKLNAKIIFHL